MSIAAGPPPHDPPVERSTRPRLVPLLVACSLLATLLAVLAPLGVLPGTGPGTASATGVATPGPVILDGTDSGLHGSINPSGTISASQLNSTWVYELKAWETLFASVPSSYANNGKVALVGASDSTATSNNCGAAAHYIAERVSSGAVTVDYFEGATAIGTLFDDVLAGTANYKLIQIVEQGWCGNGMDGTEAAVVNARGPAIAAHVNRGGALFAQSQSYGWLNSLFPTLNKSTSCSGSTPSLTDAGYAQFPGLTNANIAAPWHNCFTVSSGSFPLTQLALQSDTHTVILGGTSVEMPSNIEVMTDNPQPRPGETVCTMAMVTDAGSPVAGASVQFSVNGVVASTETTDSGGNATYCYVKVGSGTDTVTATVLSGPGIGSTTTSVGWSNVALTATPGTALTRGANVCIEATAGTFDGTNTVPTAGIAVSFSVAGPNSPAPSVVTTNGSGVAQYCYTGSEGGVDTVTASIGSGSTLDSRTLDITWNGPRVTVPAITHPASGTGKVIPMTVAQFSGATDLWATLTLPASSGTLSIDTTGLTLTRTDGSGWTNLATVDFTGTLSAITSALASRVTWNAPALGQAQTLTIEVRDAATAGSATMIATASTVLTSTIVPSISTQPTDQTTSAGLAVTFTAAASGSPTPAVQWQVSTDGGSTWNDVSGGTSPSLTITTPLESMSGYKYKARFSNSVGFVTTNVVTLTVTPPVTVPQVVTFTQIPDTHIDAASPTVTVSADSGLPLTLAADPSSVCTISGTTITLVGEGTCTITATNAGDMTHDPVTETMSFVVLGVSIQPQVINLPTIPDTPLDQSPITLPGTTDAGLPITYTASPASVCVIDGLQLVLVAEGTCTVVASAGGNSSYSPVSVTRVFVVQPSSLTLDLELEAGQSVAGAPVLVEGHGLMPFSEVRIEMHSTPILLGTVMTDANGSFSTTVRLPDSVPSGSHTIIAIGQDPAGDEVRAQEPIFVDWAGAIGASVTNSGYTPISPVRVLDTRESTKLTAGQVYELSFPSGLLPSDVTAVAVNVSVTETEAAGFVTVYACSATKPLASAINYGAGQTASNLVVAALTAGQKLCFSTMSATHLVVDLNGYHQSASGAFVSPATPTRLVDTRTTTKLAAGETVEVQVIGDGKAAAGSTTAALYVAVTEADAAGFLTVFPCGTERPWAANLTFTAGQTVGNDVLAKIGADGKVCVYTMSATHLVVDLDGSFAPSATGGSYRGLVPGRIADTRVSTIVEAGQVLELAVVGDNGAPAGTTAVSMNVATTESTTAGFLTVYPCGVDRPWAANVNFLAGQTVSGHVTAQVGTNGKVCVYASSTTHVVVDVEGYFRPTVV